MYESSQRIMMYH